MPLSNKEIRAILIAEYGDLSSALVDDIDDGICHNCGHIQSGVEPDACCYPCEECKEDTVFGVEETIIAML
jgi:hypothetical protein